MSASKQLIEAFEGIGFKRVWVEWETKMGSGHFEDVDLSDLQDWLWKEKGLWVSVRLTTDNSFWYRIGKYDELGLFCSVNEDLFFNAPSESLSDGLMKAVEIVKERKNND